MLFFVTFVKIQTCLFPTPGRTYQRAGLYVKKSLVQAYAMKLTTFMMTLAALVAMANARGLSEVPDEKIVLCINQYLESGKKCVEGKCGDIWRRCYTYDADTNTYGWKFDRNTACSDENNTDFYIRVYSCWKCRADPIMDTCMLEFFNITRSELELCTADPDECSRDPLRWDAVNKMQNSWGAEYIMDECDKKKHMSRIQVRSP